MIKRFWKYCNALRWELWLLFILAFVVICTIEFWLVNIPEFFPGSAKIGTLVSGFSFAFNSAFVFYFIVVHVKEENDRENIKTLLQNRLKGGILNSSKALGKNLAKSSEIVLEGEYPTLQELNIICNKIGPMDDSPQMYVGNHAPVKWHISLEQHFDSNEEYINSAKLASFFYNKKLVHLLEEVDRNQHKNLFQGLLEMKAKLFGAISAKLLNQYFNAIKELERFYEENLR